MTDVRSDGFDGYLAKGLGRAHVLLEQGVDDAHRDALLAACLSDVAFDGELGDSRAPYLLELARLAGITHRLVAALAEPFAGEPNGPDIVQRFELIGLLARDGVSGMRESLYRGNEQLIDRWLARRPSEPPSDEPARQLIALDGVAGAILAFRQLGRAALADDAFWDSDLLIDQARSANNGHEADARLAEARREDARVDAYLRAVEGHMARAQENVSRLPPRWWDVPWSEAQRTIERYVRGTKRTGYIAHQWGINASDEQLVIAAQALVDLPVSDLELLRPYLSVFARRAFPLDPVPLIRLIDDSRDKVAWFALNALENLHHSAVREAGLRIAEGGSLRQRTLDLLARNWKPGDEQIAERLLRADQDVDELHSTCHGLRAVVELNGSPDLVPALLVAYDRTPCSLCREEFVAALLRLSALPDDLRRECRWDASEEIRKLVAADL